MIVVLMDDHSRKLILNVAPVNFNDSSIAIGIQPYNDENQLRQIRSAHIGTYLVRRVKDEIVDIPLIQGRPTLGSPKKLQLSQNLGTVASLVRESLVQHLHSLGRTLTDFDPITVVSNPKLNLWFKQPVIGFQKIDSSQSGQFLN